MDIGQRIDGIIFILIIILALLIGYNGIYKQNLTKIDSIKASIEDEGKKNEIIGIIGAWDRKLQAYQKRSFSTAEVTKLLDRISDLAKEINIEIKAFNPLSSVSREQYIELPLEISFSCQYHQLGQFLSLVESNQEFIWLKKLDMQKPSATSAEEAKVPKIKLIVSGIYLKK